MRSGKCRGVSAKDKTVLDTEKLDDHSYKTVIYGFWKNCTGEFAPQVAYRGNSREEALQALFQKVMNFFGKSGFGPSENYQKQLASTSNWFARSLGQRSRNIWSRNENAFWLKSLKPLKEQQASAALKIKRPIFENLQFADVRPTRCLRKCITS